MPYFEKEQVYVNPFYLDVSSPVRSEMYARAKLYGTRTRSVGLINDSQGNVNLKNIDWPYKKIPWATIQSLYTTKRGTTFSMGFDTRKKDEHKYMSNLQGDLTLYDSKLNRPKYPLLTGIEISNEGQRGSLLKGKFSFTFFPELTPQGFELEEMQEVLFTAGNRVHIAFGWSESALIQKVNKLEFVGVIFGFNWNFNPNMSISAEVQIVSPSAVMMGLSGDLTTFNSDSPGVDPMNQPLPASSNLLTTIDSDILNASGNSNFEFSGLTNWLSRENTHNKVFNYSMIKLPITPGSSYMESSIDNIQLSEYNNTGGYQDGDENAVDPPPESSGTSGTPGEENREEKKYPNSLLLKFAQIVKQIFPTTTGFDYGYIPGGNDIGIPFDTAIKGRLSMIDNRKQSQTDADTLRWFFNTQVNMKEGTLIGDDKKDKDGKPDITWLNYNKKTGEQQKIGGIPIGDIRALIASNPKDDNANADLVNASPEKREEWLRYIFDKIIEYKELALLRWIKEDSFRPQTGPSGDEEAWRALKILLTFDFSSAPEYNAYIYGKNKKNTERYPLNWKYEGVNIWNNGGIIHQITEEFKKDPLLAEPLMNKIIQKLEAKISGISDANNNNGMDDDQIAKNPKDPKFVTTKNAHISQLQDFKGAGIDGSIWKKYERLDKPGIKRGGIHVSRLMKIARKYLQKDWTGIDANTRTKLEQEFSKVINELISATERERDEGKIGYVEAVLEGRQIEQEPPQDGGGGTTGSTGDDTGYVDPTVENKIFWYISLGDLVEYANRIIETFENEHKERYTFPLFRFICNENQTEYNSDLKSAFPVDVYFPDYKMGSYGSFQPYNTEEYNLKDKLRMHWRKDKDGKDGYIIYDDVINIGQIRIGVDFIRKTYRSFITDNSTNISFKNITNFFEQIIKRINAASGEIYQFTAVIFEEPEILTNSLDIITKDPAELGDTGTKRRAFISIEDTNLAKRHTVTNYEGDELDKTEDEEERRYRGFSVRPFFFEGNIMRPLIRNLNIVSRPPKEATFAAYISARGQEANNIINSNKNNTNVKKAPPISGETNLGFPEYKDLELHDKLRKEADKERISIEEKAPTTGFNERWSDEYRGAIIKMKRLIYAPYQQTSGNYKIGAHWLNKQIYPIDLTLTIDGINGFKFGDVLKTTLIPRHYNVDWDIVFTVTKIIHKLTPSTWETTLHTAARLSLDDPSTGISSIPSFQPVTAPSSQVGRTE